jgi:hypothetical protein
MWFFTGGEGKWEIGAQSAAAPMVYYGTIGWGVTWACSWKKAIEGFGRESYEST